MAMPNRRWLIGLGVPLLVVGLAAGFFLLIFSWNWFIPLAEARASTALGRSVTISGLHIRPGRVSEVTVTGLRIANPVDFPEHAPFAQVNMLVLGLDTMATLRTRVLHVTTIGIDGTDIQAVTLADGRDNFTMAFPQVEASAPAATFGTVTLRNGRAHVVHAALAADFAVTLETRDSTDNTAGLVAEARGTYAGAHLIARLTGGSILAIGNAEQPWPVTLEVENGTTRASLRGTLRNMLALEGADLHLALSGPDMRFLRPLTGVPIPSTPPFRVEGRLAYSESRFRFTEIAGVVGTSDLGGNVTLEPRGGRPDITGDLTSARVDLADLAGFIGGNPGRGTPIRDDTARSGRVLPNAPVNMPLFQAADIHARYRATRISGADSPIDSLDVTFDIINGVLTLKPLRAAIGRGAVLITGTLTPRDGENLHAVLDAQFRQIDISRVMEALGARGGGTLEGRGRIDSTGSSTAQLMARGNGSLAMRTGGGDLSAFTMDLAGLRLGNAILSAFGLPSRTRLECFIADFGLRNGVLTTRAMLLETSDAMILGGGDIRLDREELDLRLRSQAKTLTIGSLPTSLAVTGSFSDPSVAPVIVQNRGGEGLGRVLDLALAPLSLIPIIEFGSGDDPRCRDALARTRLPAGQRPSSPR